MAEASPDKPASDPTAGYLTDDDIDLLKENAIVLDGDDSLLGHGVDSAVFRGKLTNQIKSFSKTRLAKGTAVAVKVILDLDRREKEIDRAIAVHKDKDIGSHPNVVQLHTAVKIKGQGKEGKAILVMELADRSLREYLAGKLGHNVPDKLIERTAKKMTRDIIDGLEAIHKAGWRHGAVHTNNLLVFRGQPKRKEGEEEASSSSSVYDVTVKWADFEKAEKQTSTDDKEHQSKKIQDLWSVSDVFDTINQASRMTKKGHDQIDQMIKVTFQSLNRHEKEKLTPEDVYKEVKELAWYKVDQEQEARLQHLLGAKTKNPKTQ